MSTQGARVFAVVFSLVAELGTERCAVFLCVCACVRVAGTIRCVVATGLLRWANMFYFKIVQSFSMVGPGRKADSVASGATTAPY